MNALPNVGIVMIPINCISRPYYVGGLSYSQRSGGNVALHVLCHWLNTIGEKAYLIPLDKTRPTITNPYLDTPLLSPEINAFFSAENVDPVVVYPDIVVGNPFNAKCVVHLMLAAPGHFGGTKDFPPQDKVWSFSHFIASMTRSPDNILNIPVTDVRTHKLPPEGTVRKGACFYSHKYDRLHGNPLLPITDGAKRLGGTRADIVHTLQTSEVCYVYENSIIDLEATLCGCPVVLVKTPYFNQSWIHGEIGWAGVRWSDEEKEREPLALAPSQYKSIIVRFNQEQLPAFIRDTQSW